jgi:hypothetical protein
MLFFFHNLHRFAIRSNGKFRPHCLLAQSASLRQYIGVEIPIFYSSVFSFISLSLFSQLSVFPSFHLHLPHHHYIALCIAATKNNLTLRCVLPIDKGIAY